MIAYLKEAPADATLQNQLGLAYSKNGNIAEAVEVFTSLVKADSSSAEAHSNLGTAYTQQNQYRQAAEEFQKALRLAPHVSDVRIGVNYRGS